MIGAQLPVLVFFSPNASNRNSGTAILFKKQFKDYITSPSGSLGVKVVSYTPEAHKVFMEGVVV